MVVIKQNQSSSLYRPLENITLKIDNKLAARLVVCDSTGRVYFEHEAKRSNVVKFKIRGDAGTQTICLTSENDTVLETVQMRVQPRTSIACNKGPYAKLQERIEQLITRSSDIGKPWIINGKAYNFLVCWSRDHVYTLKAAQYFMEDVKTGLDYWLESQQKSGMFWDCIYDNPQDPAPAWLGEALGKGWYRYDDGKKYVVRRVPVLADTEYVFAEGVWYAWKATGDDAWMVEQLPRLEKALKYMTTDPLRWSKKHKLVRRSFTADEWDFANPHYCDGDHRCIHPGDPAFFFHGNNSGMYAMYWRMAEMYEQLGNVTRARELRADGEALRQRANDKLFFRTNYGHMIPESLDPEKVYALVGDERKRMSLSTGYTINRGMPTHAMAVKILDEYIRRGKEKKGESFAEWWTMDPPYAPEQWPGQETNMAGCPEGEYMNGGICSIVAGEIAKAAFDHGREAYGVDILDRLWMLNERDGGAMHQVYRRLPENPGLPVAEFTHVNLRPVVNKGLRYNPKSDVEAWTGEGTNDMRNLPVGKQVFGAIEFDVIDPGVNNGKSVLRLDPAGLKGPSSVTVPVAFASAHSLYFLQATAGSLGHGQVAGMYTVSYDDGTRQDIWVRNGIEIGGWWGIGDSGMDRSVVRRAWWGANPNWKTVGMFMFGWNNPYPDKKITALTLTAAKNGEAEGGIMLGGISLSSKSVAFEERIRSYGLPDCWAQAAVYYAIAEGLAGVENKGTTFSTVAVSPRWAASKADRAEVTLHYPASDGYCSYEYKLDRKKKQIVLDITGSFLSAHVHCLLPGTAATSVIVDGADVPFANVRVEQSRYADFSLDGLPEGPILIRY